MKKLFNLLRKKNSKKVSTQRELLNFVKDEENLKKAAEGSMQKRIDLMNRVELRKKNA